MATKKPDEKTVPTLVDVVVPGKTKVENQARPEIASPAPSTAKHGSVGDRSPSRATLNAKIEALVAEILVRHMDNARKEIIRRILSEIDAFSSSTSRKK